LKPAGISDENRKGCKCELAAPTFDSERNYKCLRPFENNTFSASLVKSFPPAACSSGRNYYIVLENRGVERPAISTTGEIILVIDDPKDPDIQDVMREEKSRGKRRVDSDALRRRQDLLKKFREALTLRTEREFVDAIREMKLAENPEKLRELLKIWRASF